MRESGDAGTSLQRHQPSRGFSRDTKWCPRSYEPWNGVERDADCPAAPLPRRAFMRLTFHGAAGQVTGSMHLLEAAGARVGEVAVKR